MIRLKNSYVFLVLFFVSILLTVDLSHIYADECSDGFSGSFSPNNYGDRESPIKKLNAYLEEREKQTELFEFNGSGWFPKDSHGFYPEIDLSNIYSPSRAVIQIQSRSSSESNPITETDIIDYIFALRLDYNAYRSTPNLPHIINYLRIFKSYSTSSKLALRSIFAFILQILQEDIERISQNDKLLPRVPVLTPYIQDIVDKHGKELDKIRRMIYGFAPMKPTFPIDKPQVGALLVKIYEHFLRPAPMLCSAVAVSHNAILTAAHCVIHMNSVKFTDEQGLEHESIFMKYNNNYTGETSTRYDMAVVQFPDNTFTSYLEVDFTVSKFLDQIAIIAFEDYGKYKRVAVLSMPQQTPNQLKTYTTKGGFCSVHGNSGGPMINASSRVTALISAHNTTATETRYAPISVNEYFLRETVKNRPSLIIEGLDKDQSSSSD